ncbi:MAG: hypothetical protein D3908_10310 [Candidatus Electrothrix sp. AUS4]|nr:hypothetical protein [Candidatus Electrothrix sp. AUS4]
MDTQNINKARIVYYGFFAAFFSFQLSEQHLGIIDRSIDILGQNPIDERTAKALANIKRKLKKGGYTALANESDRIFYSPATSFVPMTASYYTEQKDGGEKRLEMISYVAESTFRRNEEEYKEQEDHIEFVFIFLQKLIEEDLHGNTVCLALEKKIFKNILNGIIESFCQHLMTHEDSFIYRDVALALQSFMEFERLFLGIDAPQRTAEDLAGQIPAERKKRISQEFHKKSPRECV